MRSGAGADGESLSPVSGNDGASSSEHGSMLHSGSGSAGDCWSYPTVP